MPSRRTRVKFCGLVRPADVDAAVAIGVDAVGFVFYPQSPRRLDAAAAAALRRELPSWVQAVGLFVNATADAIAAIHREVGLDIVQLHGDETPAQAAALVAALAPRPPRGWWKALRIDARALADADRPATGRTDPPVTGQADPPATGRVAAERGAVAAALDAFAAAEHCLLDSASPGFGGSGHRFDWDLVPDGRAGRLILSGGLDADSVGAAIVRLRPFAVDTSSGIQGADPRRKDMVRMERFMAAVREADSLCGDRASTR